MDPYYVYNVAQAATGAMLHFAKASTSALDTEAFDQNQGISFFPNPTKDVLNINFGNAAQTESTFSLIDINGKTVLQQKFTAANQVEAINIKSIATGMYLAVIENTTTRSTKKIVIE